MDSYIIRKRWLVWEEVEVFADTEKEALKIAETKWAELSPQVIGTVQFAGETEMVLPEKKE
jgi:hypothetical protein